METAYYSWLQEQMTQITDITDILEHSQKSTMDITSFIEYFLKAMQNAIQDPEEGIRKTIGKTRFGDSVRLIQLNEREVKLINRLFDGFEGKLTTEKWAKIAKCSHSTALRDIKDLISKEILSEDGGNSRNTGINSIWQAESNKLALTYERATCYSSPRMNCFILIESKEKQFQLS